MRIRRGIVSVGSQVTGVADIQWDDNHTFDRSKSDDQMSGTPVETDRAGSGSLKFLSGGIATGYLTSNMVVSYYEVTQASGVESVATKTATFTGVTVNRGGGVPAEGVGEIRVKFDYSTCTIA